MHPVNFDSSAALCMLLYEPSKNRPWYSGGPMKKASIVGCGRVRTRIKPLLGVGLFGYLFLMLGGCASTTVFLSSFNANTVGTPPSHNQSVGTIDIDGVPPGNVTIVSAPPNTTGNWALISRQKSEVDPVTSMKCSLTQYSGHATGVYALLVVLFIPSGSGYATVEFDTPAQSPVPFEGFLHLDFTEANIVRIDDDNSLTFGTFPRDKPFTLSVTMDFTVSPATAHMQLIGAGASGSKDMPIPTPYLSNQFGTVNFYMGYPWNGYFDVTDIIVTHKGGQP